MVEVVDDDYDDDDGGDKDMALLTICNYASGNCYVPDCSARNETARYSLDC